MNILVCPDSFKGTLSSLEVSEIISSVLIKNGFNSIPLPVGDGGEGTVESILNGINGEKIYVKVKDPFGRIIDSYFGLKDDVAYIEAAQSSGLILLDKNELNPWLASTYGFGELISEAIKRKVKKIYLGIGGSATNDCGIGMLQALGVKFLDVNNIEIYERKNEGYSASVLSKVHSYDDSDLMKKITGIDFEVICDVFIPLFGKDGTSNIFSPQKGADEEMKIKLEQSIIYFSKIVKTQSGIETDFPGAGAAGGLGSALKVFLNAKISLGIESVIKILNIEEKIKSSDVVIVGEGSMDSQSVFGKAPYGIAWLAKKLNKKVIAINGRTDESDKMSYNKLFDEIYSCFGSEKLDLTYLKKNAKQRLTDAAKMFCNDFALSEK
jgi:glycerate 2-kinase